MKKTAVTVSIIFLLALAPAHAFGLSGELVIEGTGDSQGILRDLAWRFLRAHSNVALVIPESIGSDGGIMALKKLEIELARVSRPLTGEEKRDGFKEIVFAYTPLVFVVHPSVRDIDNITAEQAMAIYSGKITRWDEIGGAPFKIYPVAREAESGSKQLLDKHIPGFGDIETTSTAKTAYSSVEAVKIVRGHKNTIGYVPMAMAYGSGLKVLQFDGVYPSTENLFKGDYPLSVPLGLVYRERMSPVAAAFVDFLFGPVSKDVIKRYGSVPADRK